ncbi:ABC transporter substrate-binding protein [Actinomadura chibensis]|uniref:ABC transporter substrate-binding protein n=1 Tax=Actinomadura chibensis TaxID=392828 RepID=A0A5D0NRJ2_9ACTN|nr:ABC transporter substrate-binding protein [Actinomadura chibensis]TYB46721.1 ABC transporter substrate-binding protein [Actinomadura chibensis]
MNSSAVVRTVVRDSMELLVAGPDPAALRLGLLLPLSGSLGLTGPSGLSAACLAATEVNTAASLERRVELVPVDAGRAPGAVADDARLLADAGLVDAFVGFHTSDVHRALEAALAGRAPYVFTPPHEGGPRGAGVVLLGDSPGRQFTPAMLRLAERRGLRRWALVGSDYIWPQSVHRVASRTVRSLGGTVVLDRLLPFPWAAGETGFEELVDAIALARAQAVLVNLVGRDLALFNRVFAASRLATGVVRLSGALEENVLLAGGGDDTGELYSAMRSFAGQGDERRLALAERYRTAFGAAGPVLDTYAEGCYDGVHLLAALAAAGALTPRRARGAAARLLAAAGDPAVRRAWWASPLGPPSADGYLARADGLDLTVVARL